MKEILSILKLDMQIEKRSNGKAKNKKLLNFFASLAIMLIVAAFITLAVIMLSYVADESNILGLLSFCLCVIEVVLFLFAISNQIKIIFAYKDKMTLAYLPVEKWKIYMAKALNCLVKIYSLSTMMTFPLLVSFGIIFQMSFSFYLLSIVILILIPLMPFALANLILVPIMFVQNLLKNHAIINLLIKIILLVVVFYFYSEFIFNVADVVLLDKSGAGNILLQIGDVFQHQGLPSTWLADMLLLQNVTYGVCLTVFVSVISPILTLTLGAVTYKNIFNRALIEKTVAKVVKSNNNPVTPFKAYFRMEFKDLFRSSTYSFTYFGMAVAMPIMVWFCNNFILNFAVEKIGEAIIFGTTLLVVLIFASIICSPTASFISKEGDNFWILRTNPRGITIPLLAKSLVGVIVALVAVLTTFIVIVACGQIDFLKGCVIFVVAIIYLIGLVAMGFNFNFYRPNLFYNNKENNSNMIMHMVISFLFSLIVGVASIILTYSLPFWAVSLIALAFVLVFSLVNLLLLLTQYKKLYAKMEI